MSPKQIGRYEIIRELGRGGMAIVYLARDPKVDRQVAVKVLPRQFTDDPNFRGRFEQEAKAVAALEHPNIVPVYDFGEEGEQPYIVMRYMKGGSLTDRIGKSRLPWDQIADIYSRIADALTTAHQQNMTHRDIKPDNILFDRWGRAYISDFGIAKLAESAADFTGGGVIGTPAYMSPEQARGLKDIDGRSDIYTLGVILYELLSGQVPFSAKTPMGLVMAHVRNPIPNILEVAADLSPGCEQVIYQAMAKAPEGRYQTVGEMAEAVRELAAGQNDIMPTIPLDETNKIDQPSPQKTNPMQTAANRTMAHTTRTTITAAQQKIPVWLWTVGGFVLVALLLVIGPGRLLLADRGEVVELVQWGRETVEQIAFSPDGRILAIASSPGLWLYDLNTTSPLGLVEGTHNVDRVAWSPDSQQLAFGSGIAPIQIINVQTKTVVLTLAGHTDSVEGLAWSPDGSRLASASDDQTINIWDVETGEILLTLTGHTNEAESVSWSPDGRRLVSGSDDFTARVWDAETGDLIYTLSEHTDAVESVAWSPDGTWLASGSDDSTARIWDAETGDLLHTLEGHTGEVEIVIWLPDSSQVASGSDDGTIRIWDARTGQIRHVLANYTKEVKSIAWSPDGRRLAFSGVEGSVQVWTAPGGE